MNREKLRKLGQQLIHQDLAVDKFLFTRYFQDRSNHKNGCGTVGCALGHYALWSDEWEINDNDVPHLKKRGGSIFSDPIGDASIYFDIDYALAELMFIPHNDLSKKYENKLKSICEEFDLNYLKDKPPAKKVGENIIKIINMKKETRIELIKNIYKHI